MSMHTSLRRAVRAALFLGTQAVVFMALPVGVQAAQKDDQQDEEKDRITEIVVTGSRIARPEVEASTPVQIISADSIAEQGSPNIADILQELPSVGTPGLARTNSNFLTAGNGVSTINLRNMDDKRTLVLINGRRVVSGVGGTSTVDINNIPTDLLENVQVLTGGASAAYGSEAIAGVVNFKLKEDFEGISLRAQTGETSERDRKQTLWSLTFGQNIADRGNVTFNFQYDKDYGLRSRDRAISANDNPNRSSLVPQGRFIVDGGSTWTYNADNQLKRGFSSAVDGFNRNAERYIAVPLERKLWTVLAHYDLTERTKVFFEGGYSDMDSRSRLEPLATDNSDAVLPDGTIFEGLTLDNPFIPDAIRADMIAADSTTLGFAKRMNGVFDRSNRNSRDFRRFVVGFEGEVLDGWKWDVFFNQSITKEDTASETALRDRYYYALDAITGPDGTPICRDAAARANGCVPFNPFGFNSVSADAGAYITNNGQLDTYRARVEQKQAAANITGSLFELPAGDVKVAAGLERRWEESEEVYSADTQAGNTMGNALSNTFGDYTVNEAYVEAIVPLLRDLPAVKSLEVEGSARVGDYSTVGNVFSWKAGLNWAPLDDVRFRAVYSVATRAPNIGELFGGANQTFPTGLTDPCEGTTSSTPGALAAYCRSLPGLAEQFAANRDYVFEYQQSDTQSIEGEDSGNPNVNEEEAQTWTVGMVFTPTFAPRFTASIDWFQIEIDDAITLLPRQYAIDQCAASLGTSEFCAYQVREPANTPRPRTPGTIYQINANYINAASIKTSGVDLAAGYSFDFAGNQRLRFGLNYTYLDKLTLEPVKGQPIFDNVGQLDGTGRLGAGFEHRANASITYSIANFTAQWRTNYLSNIQDTRGQDDPALVPLNKIDAYLYHDLQLRMNLGAEEQYGVYLGVDNVFDKKPPVINQLMASQVTGTETAADTYDPIGRYIYGGVQLKF